jgi:hypothetical protein
VRVAASDMVMRMVINDADDTPIDWADQTQHNMSKPRTLLLVDDEQLRDLLAKNDLYGSAKQLTPEQRVKLEERLEQDISEVKQWSAVLNAMDIPQEQKEAALTQLIENVAANHRCNSILADYVPKRVAAESLARHHGNSTPFGTAITRYAFGGTLDIDDFYALSTLFTHGKAQH